MRTIIFIHFVLLNILSFSISAQPIFEKPQIQGTVLEEFSSVDEYSGWIYFKEQSNIKAEDFFTNYKDVFSLSNSDEMILEKKEDESDLEGYSQYRYKQLYEDIEVERSGYVIRTKNGVAYVAYGKLVRDLNLELSNVIPEKTALENALYEINASKYAWEDEEWESGIKNDSNESKTTWYPKGELKITPINTDDWSKENYRLAYFFSITTLKPTYDTYGVYIDASSGDFIKMKSLKKYDYCAIGTTNTVFDGNNISINTMYRSSYNDYILQDECRGGTFTVKNYTGGFWTLLPKIYQPTNVWGSPTYKSQATCLWAVEKAWDYYSNIHGRNGMSNSNRDIHIWYDTDLNSAGYNKRTFYDEIFVGPNWEDLDIIGHEFTHGVIAHTTELDGNNSEADALDESYADIFGVLIEDYVKGGLDWNYGDHFGAIEFRNLSDPFASDLAQPKFYMGTNWNMSGESHTNGGVNNYWFYLLTQGAHGVVGIGKTNARFIAYKAMTSYLPSYATYSDARACTRQIAIDYYGICSNEVAQVCAAWDKVGVLGTGYTYCCTIAGASVLCDDGSSLPSTYTVLTRYGSSYSWTIPSGWFPSTNPTTNSTYILGSTSVTTPKTISVTVTRQSITATCSLTVQVIDCEPDEDCPPLCKYDNLVWDKDISLYPVPANNYITIQLTENLLGGDLRIIDALGRIREDMTIMENKFDIGTQKLSNGTYFLTITSTGIKKILPFSIVR